MSSAWVNVNEQEKNKENWGKGGKKSKKDEG